MTALGVFCFQRVFMTESFNQKSALARRTGVVLATGFLAATFMVLYACRSRSPAGSAAEAPDAVGYAVRFVAAVPADDDVWVREQGKVLEKVVQVCIRRHEADRALVVAGRIPSWHRGSAYADLAVIFAREGKLETATNLLREAVAWQGVMRQRYEGGTLGWCVSRIGGHIAAAEVAMGMSTPQSSVAAMTQSVGCVSLFGSSAAAFTNTESRQVLAVLEPLGKTQDLEIQGMYLDGLLMWGEAARMLTTNDVVCMAEAIHQSLAVQPPSQVISARCRLAGLWWKCGKGEMAELEIQEAERLAKALPTGYLRTVAYGEIAATRFGRGMVSGAALFEEAVEEAGRCLSVDRLQAYSRLACYAVMMNDHPRAESLFTCALDEAEAVSVVQARRLNLAGVCIAMGDAWRDVPESLRRRLAAVAAVECPITVVDRGCWE